VPIRDKNTDKKTVFCFILRVRFDSMFRMDVRNGQSRIFVAQTDNHGSLTLYSAKAIIVPHGII